MRAAARNWDERVAKAVSIWSAVEALRTCSWTPFTRAVSCMAWSTRSVCGLFGFTSKAIVLVCGTNSVMSSNRFACISTTKS
jgi:hypothetical protein